MNMLCKNIALDDYQATIRTVTSTANNLQAQLDEHKYELCKQEARHCNYIECNEKHISDIEEQLSKIEHALIESNKYIRRNSICIKVLCAGLFCAGIAIFALIYHVLTM